VHGWLAGWWLAGWLVVGWLVVGGGLILGSDGDEVMVQEPDHQPSNHQPQTD
jgi:hypothetical protein